MQRSFVMNRPRDVEQSWTCLIKAYRFREEELAITSSVGSRYLVISPCYNYTYHRGAVARLRRSYNKDVRFSPLFPPPWRGSRRNWSQWPWKFSATDFHGGRLDPSSFQRTKNTTKGWKKARQRTRVVWTWRRGSNEIVESESPYESERNIESEYGASQGGCKWK